MSHITPLTQAELEQHKDIFQLVEGAMGFVPNSMLTMARKPGLLEAFTGLAALIQGPGKVPDGLKSLIAFVTSRSAGCNYCMAHTSHTAVVKRGVPEEKLNAIWDFERSDLFSDAERAALTVAQGAAQVPNATTAADFAELKKHFDDEQIVEIVGVISLFGYLNRWNDTMATSLETEPVAFADSHLSSHGWKVGKHE